RRRFLKAMKERDGLSSASIPGILATIEGYNHAEDWVDSLVEYLYGNMETVSSFLRRHLPEFQFSMPEATYGLDRRIPRPLHGRGVAGSPDPPGKSGDHARKRVRSEHFFLFAHECRLPPLQSA